MAILNTRVVGFGNTTTAGGVDKYFQAGNGAAQMASPHSTSSAGSPITSNQFSTSIWTGPPNGSFTNSNWFTSSSSIDAHGEITTHSRSSLDSKQPSPMNSTNAFFNAWIGGDAFAPYKADMGLNIYARSREEKASGYQDMVPGLYNQYVNYQLSGVDLFHQANSYMTANDRDTLNTNYIGNKVGALPSVTYSFGRSGGGISGRGFSTRF